MSPEEQQRFLAQKREEFRARQRSARENGRHGGLRRGRGGSASVDGDSPRQGATAPDESMRAKRAELEELRSAALKARADYEESMGEATAAKYRRRSLGYWMNRVKRQRERAAEHERQQPPSKYAGADASENKPETNTRKE